MSVAAPPNFDRVARIYRWAEYIALGPVLVRTREHFLSRLSGCRRALVLGDGDGRFLARLLAVQPGLSAVAVDTSAAMLRLLERRCRAAMPEAAQRLRTVCGSALEIVPEPGTDLVVTHFFLDCLSQAEVERLARTMAAHTAPGTLWLLSDFGEPRWRMLRPFAALYVRSLYLAFRVLTGLRIQRLPDPQAALQGTGFTRVARAERLMGLVYTEVWRRVE